MGFIKKTTRGHNTTLPITPRPLVNCQILGRSSTEVYVPYNPEGCDPEQNPPGE